MFIRSNNEWISMWNMSTKLKKKNEKSNKAVGVCGNMDKVGKKPITSATVYISLFVQHFKKQ